MVIGSIATLALYCSHCGKIHTHSISRFTVKGNLQRELFCSCGQLQASIMSARHNQYLLCIPCVVCEANHIICLDIKQFGRGAVDGEKNTVKLYCPVENTELGFAGERQVVEAAIYEYNEEIERMTQEIDEQDFEYCEHIENPQVMFEVLNQIHDIAERGDVFCRCGSVSIEASIRPESIELECRQCGGHQAIPAKTEFDLARVEMLQSIEITPPCRFNHKN